MKEIKLTQGQVALVDDEDFEFLSQFKWFAKKSGNTYYAIRNARNDTGKHIVLSMHREILCLEDSELLSDHKDGNGLNNQRNNLRVATRSQNCSNRRAKKNGVSQYLGVNWLPDRKKWKAEIRKNGKLIHLGRFTNEIDAALAYNNAANKLHGEFANPNKIIQC